MKIKICGLKVPENINSISLLEPDYMGFIFYDKSKRYVGNDFTSDALQYIGNAKKTGVFVNESADNVLSIIDKHHLDAVQLHGNESIPYCESLKKQNCIVIKAFPMHTQFNFSSLNGYARTCDYFLFDTQTENYGGSGKAFNWQLLKHYNFKIPFFLSGGLGQENIDTVLKFKHPMLYGLDFNSKLETSPGYKDVTTTQQIIKKIREYEFI
jgi:phosphoribosylanthranilate isomerase